MRLLLILLMTLLLLRCSSVEVTLIEGYQDRGPSSIVDVYYNEKTIHRSYKHIAILEAQSAESYNSLVQKVEKEARELGADGIIVREEVKIVKTRCTYQYGYYGHYGNYGHRYYGGGGHYRYAHHSYWHYPYAGYSYCAPYTYSINSVTAIAIRYDKKKYH